MIPLSDRHAVPAMIVVLILSIPIAYHAIARPRIDDCASPARLREPNFLPFSAKDSIPPRQSAEQVGGWREGELLIDGQWKIRPRWRFTRTYDPKYYIAPPRFFYNFFPEHTTGTLVRSVDGVELPIHVRVDDSEGMRNFAGYLYVFGGRPVRSPLAASLRHTIPQVTNGALPLTVILVEGGSAFAQASKNEEILLEWMRSAWVTLDGVCGS